MVKNRAMWKRAACWGKKIVQLRAELFQFRWQTTICKKWRQFLPASSCEVSCGIGSFFSFIPAPLSTLEFSFIIFPSLLFFPARLTLEKC